MKLERTVLTDHRNLDGSDAKAVAIIPRPEDDSHRVEFGVVTTASGDEIGILYVRGYDPRSGRRTCSVIHLDDASRAALAAVIDPSDPPDEDEQEITPATQETH